MRAASPGPWKCLLRAERSEEQPDLYRQRRYRAGTFKRPPHLALGQVIVVACRWGWRRELADPDGRGIRVGFISRLQMSHVDGTPGVAGTGRNQRVSPISFSARNDLDRVNGAFSRVGHPLKGENVGGKILVAQTCKAA